VLGRLDAGREPFKQSATRAPIVIYSILGDVAENRGGVGAGSLPQRNLYIVEDMTRRPSKPGRSSSHTDY